MFDAKLMLIDSTANVTVAVTGNAVDFRGEDATMLEYRILVPAAAASTTMTITIQESEDGSTNWLDLVKSPAISAAGQTHVHARGKKRYRRAVIAVTGTSPNFGKVRVGVVPAGTHRDW